MRKRISKKARMLRLSDAFLPLALLICAALGKSNTSEQVYMNLLFPALLALASARGVRIAFAEQPSMRRVAGSVKLALALQFIGAFGFFVIDLIRNHGRFVLTDAVYIVIGMLLNMEHVFYEYLFATGDGASASMVRAITAAVTAGGILMTSAASGEGLLPYSLEWLLGGATLAAVLAAVIGRSIGGRLKGKVNNRVLKCAPRSMIQTAIYPVAWLVALVILKPIMYDGLTAIPFFAGLTAYELSRTPFRRSFTESRGFNVAMLLLLLLGGALIAQFYIPQARNLLETTLGRWSHELAPTGVMLAASALCAFGMYGTLRRKGD